MNRSITYSLALALALTLFAGPAPVSAAPKAPAIRMCAATTTGAIRFANGRCKKTETQVSTLSQLTGLIGPTGAQGAQGPTGAQGLTGATGPMQLVGMVHLDQAGALLSSIKGTNTTDITTSRDSAGTYEIIFTGNFTGFSATDTLTNESKTFVFSSARSWGYAVSNAYVDYATPTSITVKLYTWISLENPGPATGVDLNGGYVSVYWAQ